MKRGEMLGGRDAAKAAGDQPVTGLVARLGMAPWVALFVVLLAWGWRAYDLWHTLPAYEDTLEVVWLIDWYNGALRGLHGAQVYPLAFHPAGWQVATYAGGPALFLVLLPLSWLGGAAFAANAGALLTFVLAFAGAHLLGRRLLERGPAALAALLFTFWSYRWYSTVGQHNVLLASALLPWLLLAADRALAASSSPHALSSDNPRPPAFFITPERSGAGRVPPRPAIFWRWLALTGLLWALMGLSSLYFVWIGGLALAAWALGRVLAKENSLRSALLVVALPALMALILLAPWLYWFVRASAAANAPFFGLNEISQWDASLNSLPIPSPLHPYLGGLARVLYSGPANEPGLANFGLLAAVLAILGLGLAWRDRRWLPPILLALTGLILALGLTLKWNGEVVQWAPLRPLDRALWGLGHVLKPGTFGTPEPPAPFDSALPLPGWLLAAIVPFWERARVFARYALVASVGVFLLAGLAISRMRWRWVSAALAGLLLFEVLPAPTASYPFPLRPHPAFEWLATQTLAPGEGVIDLGSWQPGVLFMPIGGETLWATEFHGKPTVAGASSVLPAHVAALSDWLATHSDPFGDPVFLPLLRSYKVRYILFHVSEGPARDALAEARANPALAGTRCFEPAPGPGPWDYPICIMDLESSTG